MTNINDTIWVPNQTQQGEYSVTGVLSLVDPSAVAIVDPSAVQVVDTGVTYSPMSNTTWLVSDGS